MASKKIKKFLGPDGQPIKGTPAHVRSAINYNLMLKDMKADAQYTEIVGGDKIKWVHLRQPNIYQSSAFSFMTSFPRELDLIDKIDYDTQFEKSFCEPLRFITDKMNWLIDSSYGTQGSIEVFFS